MGEPQFEDGERIFVGVDVGGTRSHSAVVWCNEDLHVGAAIYHGEEGVLECIDTVRELAGRYLVAECCFVSEYLGHASVTITFDRYGHLFPGSEQEAAGQLDAYLLRAEGDWRGTQSPTGPDSTGDNRNGGEGATPVTERDSAP